MSRLNSNPTDVRRTLFNSNSSNSDLTRRFRALEQDIDPSLQQDEEFRNLSSSEPSW